MSEIISATSNDGASRPRADRSLRVALIGSRGIPANYGGYETFMEEISTRLVERGLDVTVYCRSHHTPRELEEHRGVHLTTLPTVRTKHLDTPVHTLLSTLHAALRRRHGGRRFDAALVVNGANAMFVPLLRLAGIPTALHVDGIEKRRSKWGPFGRLVYSVSERLAPWVATRLVTDADVIEEHYLERFGAPSTVIAYGVDPRPLPPPPDGTLEALGLEPRRYFLYVSRFEPENNPHRVVEAYRLVRGSLPLVMVGGAPYADHFIEEMKSRADRRVLFPGPIYGEGYRELLSNARAYIHATEVGGTHPALVEAMGYGNCVIVNDAPENREVAGAAGLWFEVGRPESLAVILERLRHDASEADRMGKLAAARAAEFYNWDRVTSQYLELFEALDAH